MIHEFGHIIDRNNPEIRQDILYVLQQKARNANLELDEIIEENISTYAAIRNNNSANFTELVSEMNNAYNGTNPNFVKDLIYKAGVKL
ncbi:MAG: hypothetical protein PUG52_03405 [Absicoccus porci]|uniref:hypothetical protein n=1 Tax=Absicoccus porci TaxID=2486576 RepID=UPI0023F20BA2|nr:hypothetical protein [Absicoccus porci]MDD7330071.1 hypothetical protein [Absicoccus porci]MDY4738062.1 hypothetical protein [Absicoccus porci]